MKRINFRKQIKTGLKRQKMSIPQLARKVGLNHETIYRYLRGGSEITAKNLENILKILQQ